MWSCLSETPLLCHCLELLTCVWACFTDPHPIYNYLLFLTCCVILYLSMYINLIFSNFVIVGDFNVDFTSTYPLYAHLSDFITSFRLSQM